MSSSQHDGASACRECGRAAPPGASFCPACGSALSAAPAPETRKQVTVVFADLAGSTALGERLDPEALRHVQMRYFAACERALTRHGGTVEKFIGDAVMCVFGIPTAREDDALRGCRAALDLVAAVDALNIDLEAEWDVRLSVRTGVNSGPVVAGDPTGGQALVTGDAVNMAARLEQAAGPGQVLLGPLTRTLVGDAALCEALPPLELKGKSERLPAWRLVAFEQGEGAVAADGPLLGRDEEMARLRAWRAGAGGEGPGGLALLVAGPGVGKSRLLAALAEEAPDRVLRGRCPPYGEGVTYWPLADWLAALGDDEIAAAGETAATALRAVVGEGDAAPTTGEIAASVGSLATALARDGPLLLVIEDLQWAEPAMLDLAEQLAALPGVALAGAARPELLDARQGLATEPAICLLRLGPLAPRPSDELARRLAPDLPEEDRHRLLAVAEGNPLVIAQLARHLAEGGDPAALPPASRPCSRRGSSGWRPRSARWPSGRR